jgi:PKD repeat protein
VGDTILFDASASAPSTGNSIVAYAWDFGDGNASPRVPYLTSTGPTITHEYNKSGSFTVGLTVIDSAGKRATATYTLIVAS